MEKRKIEDKLNEVLGLADKIMEECEDKVELNEDEIDPEVPFLEAVYTDSSALEVISPDKSVLPKREEPPSENHSQDVSKDYEYSRKTIYYLIEKGTSALDDLMEYAKESQEPRAYEVVSELIRTVMEANREVLEIHKSMKKIEDEGVKPNDGGPQGPVTNMAFIGTSEDMSKIAREAIEALKENKNG